MCINIHKLSFDIKFPIRLLDLALRRHIAPVLIISKTAHELAHNNKQAGRVLFWLTTLTEFVVPRRKQFKPKI